MPRFSLLLCFLLITVTYCSAQRTDSVTTPASTKFKISGSRSFWMGANYRREWTTPVTAPVVNLATEHGGLTPVKRGGGKQTRSLRVKDPSGREYTFRSIQKFITSKTLPIDLQSEAAEDLVADGVSASYPYAALSVPILADAAGLPYNKVKLVYIPDDPLLGEHRHDFANLLAYLEDRLPDSVSKGWDTDEVVEKLKDDNDNEVDQLALLRLRILDMFVMDLDRHEDQWIWGAYEKDKGKVYYPIAKDRDQAFYTNQGLLPGIVSWPWLVPQLEGIKSEARNIKRFNFAARNLDRFFLNELTEDQWKQAAEQFVTKMTDNVIERALNQQPREIRNISGPKLVQILKDRRQYLVPEVIEYYRFISEIVSVVGSDKKELFDITRNSDGSVLLQVYKINKEGEQSSKMYERTFDAGITEEIRLYGFGGNDKFTVKGNNDKIKIRMIGGDGEDNFEHTASSGDGGIVYDREDGNNTITGKFNQKLENDTLVNSYQRIYYKYNQVIPFITVGYNRDDGVYLGASLKFIHHGFRKDPYKNMHQISVSHALATSAFNFRYYSEFISVLSKNSDLLFDADIKSPNNTTNFFGYGANSIYDKTKPGEFRYYRARYNLGDISLLLRNNFSKRLIMTFGPTFEFYSLDSTDNLNRNIIMTGTNGLNPATLYQKQTYFGGKFLFSADTRDNAILPTRGVNWLTGVRHLSGTNKQSYAFTQVNSELTFYLTLIKNRIVLANRLGGGHNFGDFEFYQAQYLGGEDNLRGYRKYRFAGRSKVFNNAELRIRLSNFQTYLFPGSLGLLTFYDAGRIWSDVNDSDKWLSGYGVGFWISPLRRLVLTVTYTASKEDKLPLVGLGWKF